MPFNEDTKAYRLTENIINSLISVPLLLEGNKILLGSASGRRLKDRNATPPAYRTPSPENSTFAVAVNLITLLVLIFFNWVVYSDSPEPDRRKLSIFISLLRWAAHCNPWSLPLSSQEAARFRVVELNKRDAASLKRTSPRNKTRFVDGAHLQIKRNTWSPVHIILCAFNWPFSPTLIRVSSASRNEQARLGLKVSVCFLLRSRVEMTEARRDERWTLFPAWGVSRVCPPSQLPMRFLTFLFSPSEVFLSVLWGLVSLADDKEEALWRLRNNDGCPHPPPCTSLRGHCRVFWALLILFSEKKKTSRQWSCSQSYHSTNLGSACQEMEVIAEGAAVNCFCLTQFGRPSGATVHFSSLFVANRSYPAYSAGNEPADLDGNKNGGNW